MKKTFFVLFFFAVNIVPAGFALAHATPITYEPASGDSVQSAPGSVLIRFSERVEDHASSMSVFAPDGSRVNSKDAATDPANQHILSVPILDKGTGTYTVSWQVVSADDGHFTKGAFSFSVGAAHNSGASQQMQQVEVVTFSTLPEGFTIWLALLGDAMMIGALLIVAYLWRISSESKGGIFTQRFTFFAYGGSVLSCVGSLAYIYVKSSALAQLQGSSLMHASNAFVSTVAGAYAFWSACVSVLFFLGVLRWKHHIVSSRFFTKPEWMLWGMILALAFFRARVSHAAASHFYPNVAVFVNFLHVLAKDAWVGTVGAFVLIYLAETRGSVSLLVMRRFWRVMSIILGVTAVTGTYIVWLHLKDPSNIMTTDWGSRFVMLSLVGALLLCARLAEQLYGAWVYRSGNRERIVRMGSRIPALLAFEILIGIVLLFVTSFMIITTPPLSFGDRVLKEIETNGVRVVFDQYPYEEGQFRVAMISTIDGKPVDIDKLVVTATNSEKSIGPIVIPAARIFAGGFIFSQSPMSLPGIWSIDVTGVRTGSYDVTAHFDVGMPLELVDMDARHFDTFALVHVMLAIGALFFAAALYRYAAYVTRQDDILTIDAPEGNPWFAALVVVFLMALFLLRFYNFDLKSDFQKQCETDGNMWHVMTPMHDGRILSETSFAGCMARDGSYHFPDGREYNYFVGHR